MKTFKKMKLVLLSFMLLLLTGCIEIESGEKIGQIVSIKKQGLFFKTWEVTIIRGGFEEGTGTIGKSFSATIEDSRILEKAKNEIDSKGSIKIRYHSELTCAPWRASSCHFIDEIS